MHLVHQVQKERRIKIPPNEEIVKRYVEMLRCEYGNADELCIYLRKFSFNQQFDSNNSNSQFYTLTPPIESEPTSIVSSSPITPVTPQVFELTEAVCIQIISNSVNYF